MTHFGKIASVLAITLMGTCSANAGWFDPAHHPSKDKGI